MGIGAESIYRSRTSEVPVMCARCNRRGNKTTYFVAVGVWLLSSRSQAPQEGVGKTAAWIFQRPRDRTPGQIQRGFLWDRGPIRGSISHPDFPPPRPRISWPPQLLHNVEYLGNENELIEFGECRSSTCRHASEPMLAAELIVGLENALRYPPRGVIALYV